VCIVRIQQREKERVFFIFKMRGIFQNKANTFTVR